MYQEQESFHIATIINTFGLPLTENHTIRLFTYYIQIAAFKNTLCLISYRNYLNDYLLISKR
jgi:hypothetical protein